MGREVATLVDAALQAGNYRIPFHAGGLANGTYYYRFMANGYQETKQFIIVK